MLNEHNKGVIYNIIAKIKEAHGVDNILPENRFDELVEEIGEYIIVNIDILGGE